MSPDLVLFIMGMSFGFLIGRYFALKEGEQNGEEEIK